MAEPLIFALERVDVDVTLPLPELLRSVERQIAHASVEVAFSFEADGSLLLRKAGEHSMIQFTPVELLKIRNSYFTHNHPQRGFLSAADILFAHQHKSGRNARRSGRGCVRTQPTDRGLERNPGHPFFYSRQQLARRQIQPRWQPTKTTSRAATTGGNAR